MIIIITVIIIIQNNKLFHLCPRAHREKRGALGLPVPKDRLEVLVCPEPEAPTETADLRLVIPLALTVVIPLALSLLLLDNACRFNNADYPVILRLNRFELVALSLHSFSSLYK